MAMSRQRIATIKEETLAYMAVKCGDLLADLSRRILGGCVGRKKRRDLPKVDEATMQQVRLALLVPLKQILESMRVEVVDSQPAEEGN
jgi:predicted  nucleic acid-binding Zn-ribbon protein